VGVFACFLVTCMRYMYLQNICTFGQCLPSASIKIVYNLEGVGGWVWVGIGFIFHK
jgi:hypothetical protein